MLVVELTLGENACLAHGSVQTEIEHYYFFPQYPPPSELELSGGDVGKEDEDERAGESSSQETFCSFPSGYLTKHYCLTIRLFFLIAV